MKKIGSREFGNGWRKQEQPVEVYNREVFLGTWIPAGEQVVGFFGEEIEHRSSLMAAQQKNEAVLDRQSAVEAQKARDRLLNAAFSRKTAEKPKKWPKTRK